jgi:hypothetical protein
MFYNFLRFLIVITTQQKYKNAVEYRMLLTCWGMLLKVVFFVKINAKSCLTLLFRNYEIQI